MLLGRGFQVFRGKGVCVMAIIERPSAGEFQRFLIEGGSIQFVIGACDVDPDGCILPSLAPCTLLGGFQIPRELDEPITQRSLAEAIDGTSWCHIERLIVRRGGTINYRQLSPDSYQATCLIALGHVLDMDDLTPDQGGTSHLSASLHR